MANYAYKDVCYSIPEKYTGEEFEKRYGVEFEADANYDGDYWIAVGDWISDLQNRLAAYERQTIQRTDDMPADAVGWERRQLKSASEGNRNMRCYWIGQRGKYNAAPDVLPDVPGEIVRAIVDLPESD